MLYCIIFFILLLKKEVYSFAMYNALLFVRINNNTIKNSIIAYAKKKTKG